MTHASVFTYPFNYWVGMDTDPGTTPEALAEFNRFYSTTHVGEVVAAHPGFVTGSRYELVDDASSQHGLPGPRWLAVYGMADEAAAEQYVKDNQRPWLHRQKYSPWPAARRRAKIVLRMLWRSTASAGSLTGPAEQMLVLGTSGPPDLTALPGYSHVTCFEVYRAYNPPPSDAPRFCVIHESDAQNTVPSATVESIPAAWRLLYRHIPPPTS